jgi:hypothetical protein
MAKPRLGSGKRFAALSQKLGKQPGIRNPAGLAAAIGRKKYGKYKMSMLASGARRRAYHQSVG